MEDKVNVFGLATFNRLLDDVVAILILDATEDVVLELADKRGLLVVENVLKCLHTRVSRVMAFKTGRKRDGKE